MVILAECLLGAMDGVSPKSLPCSQGEILSLLSVVLHSYESNTDSSPQNQCPAMLEKLLQLSPYKQVMQPPGRGSCRGKQPVQRPMQPHISVVLSQASCSSVL